MTNGLVMESNNTGSAVSNHAYALPGVYVVTVKVVGDTYYFSDQLQYEYVVVYDPVGGSVRGGGTIDSPLGAYTADSSLAGKARFGFSSKYANGAQTPMGNTRFSFRVAGFKFVSTSYDWLVVAGSKAMYKGSGEVNRMGDYGFLLSGIDGDIPGGGGLDKFRLKVWDKVTGEVVYDNQLGADENVNVTTLLTSGKITITQ